MTNFCYSAVFIISNAFNKKCHTSRSITFVGVFFVIDAFQIAGAFCNGEIGPLSNTTYLHGYTACWGLLRHAPLVASPED